MALEKQIYLPTGGSASFHVLTGWQDYPRSDNSDVTISSWTDKEAYQDGAAPLNAQTIRMKTVDIRAQLAKNLGNPSTYDDEVEEAVRLFAPDFNGASLTETPERLPELKTRLVASIKENHAQQIAEKYTEEQRENAETILNSAKLPAQDGLVPPTNDEVAYAKEVSDWCARKNGEMKIAVDAVMNARRYSELARLQAL